MRRLGVLLGMAVAALASGCLSPCYVAGGVVGWHQPDARLVAAGLGVGDGNVTVQEFGPVDGLPVPVPAAFADRLGPTASVLWITRDHGDAGLHLSWDPSGQAWLQQGGDALDARRGAKALLRTLGADAGDVEAWAERNAGEFGGEARPGRRAIRVDVPLDVAGALERAAASADLRPTAGASAWFTSGPDRWWLSVPATVVDRYPLGTIAITGQDYVSVAVLEEPRGAAEAAEAGAARAALFGWTATAQEGARFHPSVVCTS